MGRMSSWSPYEFTLFGSAVLSPAHAEAARRAAVLCGATEDALLDAVIERLGGYGWSLSDVAGRIRSVAHVDLPDFTEYFMDGTHLVTIERVYEPAIGVRVHKGLTK